MQVRKFLSLCLQYNVKIAVRWIPSEFNWADKPSRFAEPAQSSSRDVLSILDRPHSPECVHHHGADTGDPAADNDPIVHKKYPYSQADIVGSGPDPNGGQDTFQTAAEQTLEAWRGLQKHRHHDYGILGLSDQEETLPLC